ncbi:hypothetical protein NSU08_39215 [Paenibacillus sp. FSL H7-0331]|uniref:hypothetical protein n=2 Tax=Paenibacillus sp. FSL H7-0331 TaxID=1920421 RepID=UPI0030F7D04A
MNKIIDKYISPKNAENMTLIGSLITLLVVSLYHDLYGNSLPSEFYLIFAFISFFIIFTVMTSFIVDFTKERVRLTILINVLAVPLSGFLFQIILVNFTKLNDSIASYGFLIFLVICLSAQYFTIKKMCRYYCERKEYHIANYLIDKIKINAGYIAAIYGATVAIINFFKEYDFMREFLDSIRFDFNDVYLQCILVIFIVGLFRTILDQLIFNVNLKEGKKYQNIS